MKFFLKWIFFLILLSSGIAYFTLGDNFYRTNGELNQLKMAVIESGYILPWIAAFKVICAILMLSAKTYRFGILISLGYSINIFLYCLFVAQDVLVFSVIILIINVVLVFFEREKYKLLF